MAPNQCKKKPSLKNKHLSSVRSNQLVRTGLILVGHYNTEQKDTALE